MAPFTNLERKAIGYSSGGADRLQTSFVLSCALTFMSSDKELAFRYDLFITPDWRDRFDTLVNKSVKMPLEARILDVNCGTGAHAIELAEQMPGKREVVGIDPSAERIAIARAKALVKKAKDVKFEQGIASDLPFESHEFDVVIGDASMLPVDELEDVLAEMVRVARPEGRVILKLTTRGTFDEFELMLEHSGVRNVESFISREEFSFDTAEGFLESPLIADSFLTDWLDIVPAESRDEVVGRLVAIIERERNNAPFDVSVKAAVIAGVK